jgi:hypothetical protein
MIPSIKKCLSIVIPIAWGISTLASSGFAGQQGKPALDNERRIAIYGLVRQVETQTRIFENVLKPSLKTTVLSKSGSREDLVSLANNMRYEAIKVKYDFEAGKSNDTLVADLSDLFVSAEQVNVIVGNVTLGAQAESEWPSVRDAINNLGSVYGLKALGSESQIGE